MLARVIVTDWEPGVAQRSVELGFAPERMTMREFLRHRLIAEVEEDGVLADEARTGLERWCVTPGAIEVALNGGHRSYGPSAMPWAEWDDRIEARLRGIETAFEGRRFVALFDGSQIANLEQRVIVRDQSKAMFIRLVPLVGG